MSHAFIVAAKRTPVCPRNGAFRALETSELGAVAITALLQAAGCPPSEIDEAIVGNALYGGGNPARVIALAAGLPENRPALTIDTQCCAGLDAIMLAATLVQAGRAELVIAGGAESFSRSPLRLRRPLELRGQPIEYQRPPFAPWAERDPDPFAAAAAFADARRYARAAQEAFACESHRKARCADQGGELAALAGINCDSFMRALTPAACARLPALAGAKDHAVTMATAAVEADAAAFVLVASERAAAKLAPVHACRIAGASRMGCAPEMPMIGAQAAAAALPLTGRTLAVAEIMEAFACQAMGAIADLSLDADIVNRGGGALSRGHPIGASGAILAVRLFHELAREASGAAGLAAIAAMGGLGSALLLERV